MREPRAARMPRRPPLWLLGSCVCVSAVLVAGALVAGAGDSRLRVHATPGSAWLVSPAGHVSLLDGTVARASGWVVPASDAAQVDLKSRGALQVAQLGSDAYVADVAAGAVTRIDGRDLSIVSSHMNYDRSVHVYATSRAVYVTAPTRGILDVLDPRSLRLEKSVPAQSADAVVDALGGLWFVDTAHGQLITLVGKRRRPHAEVADPAHAQLVIAGGRPVVVDTANRTARLVNADGSIGAATDLDVSAAALAARTPTHSAPIAGSMSGRQLYTSVGVTGQLLITDLARHTNSSVSIIDPGHDLGTPVENAATVFVPDYTAHRLIAVDPVRLTHTAHAFPALNSDYQFVTAAGGLLYYTNPDGIDAGVITPEGGVLATSSQALRHPRVTPPKRPISSETVTSGPAPSAAPTPPSGATRQPPYSGVNTSQSRRSGPDFSPSTSWSTSPVGHQEITITVSGPMDDCASSQITFSIAGADVGGLDSRLIWNFGDHSTGTGSKNQAPGVSHHYAAGRYFPSLSVFRHGVLQPEVEGPPVTISSCSVLTIQFAGNGSESDTVGTVEVYDGKQLLKTCKEQCDVPAFRGHVFRLYLIPSNFARVDGPPAGAYGCIDGAGSGEISCDVSADKRNVTVTYVLNSETLRTLRDSSESGDGDFSVAGAVKTSCDSGVECWTFSPRTALDKIKITAIPSSSSNLSLVTAWSGCKPDAATSTQCTIAYAPGQKYITVTFSHAQYVNASASGSWAIQRPCVTLPNGHRSCPPPLEGFVTITDTADRRCDQFSSPCQWLFVSGSTVQLSDGGQGTWGASCAGVTKSTCSVLIPSSRDVDVSLTGI